MKTSIEYLKDLVDVLGKDWKSKLDSYLKDEEIELNAESKECIENFFLVCIEEIKDNKTSNLQKVEKMIDNELLYKNMKEYLDNLLRSFYAFAPLRALGVKEPDRAGEVMQQVFEQTILRFNPDIVKDYDQYGFDNVGAFAAFLNAQDGICSFLVGKNMYYGMMEDFIYTQTRLPKKLCAQMADLIEHHFEALKLNYIIEKLNSLE